MALRDGAYRLVRTTQVPVLLGDDELELRVEILQNVADPGAFRAQIWAVEHYRITPTFPQDDAGTPAHDASDELIIKQFEGFEPSFDQPVAASDAVEVERRIYAELEAWLAEHANL